MKNVTPETIEHEALEARLTVTDVLAKAGVSRSAFYRAKRGEGKMLPLTKARLMDAISALRSTGHE
jgi:hypothetical protein